MNLRIPLMSFLMIGTFASAQDPVKVDPAHYHVLFENAHTRALEYRDKPGDKAPMHSHPAYMTYVTGAGKTKIVQPNGESNVEDTTGSEFACRPATQHATENVGNTPTQELLVEFKDATNPCSGERLGTANGNVEEGAQPEPDARGSDPSEDERTLKQLEQDWLDAYREGNAEKMSRILADDFVGRWGDGSTTDKRGTVEPVRTGTDRHSSNHLDECNVRIYGDTAIVTGIQTEQSVLEGRDGSGTYSYTDVFVKRGRRWQIVASETKRVAGRSARERLNGSWKEISSEESLRDGTVLHLDEVGLVTYDASGHMSGQSMRRSEPKQQVPSDSIYQSNGYDAYFGTFTVDESKHTVTHHVEGSVARALVGKDLVRSYSFEGGRLILKPINANEHWTVVFEKNKSY